MKFCPALNRSCERIDCYDGPACIIERPMRWKGYCPKCHGLVETTSRIFTDVATCPHCGASVPLTGTPSDPVNHPDHYGGDTMYEVIKVIEAWGLDNDFCLGNTIKYIARAGKKNEHPVTDLKKALWYLERKIKNLENANRTDNKYGDA